MFENNGMSSAGKSKEKGFTIKLQSLEADVTGHVVHYGTLAYCFFVLRV